MYFVCACIECLLLNQLAVQPCQRAVQPPPRADRTERFCRILWSFCASLPTFGERARRSAERADGPGQRAYPTRFVAIAPRPVGTEDVVPDTVMPFRFVLLTLAACAVTTGSAQQTATAPEPLALVNASVLDPTNGSLQRDVVVVLRGGRIESIGTGPAPAGVRTLDVRGRYVLP